MRACFERVPGFERRVDADEALTISPVQAAACRDQCHASDAVTEAAQRAAARDRNGGKLAAHRVLAAASVL
jgi:hypothetical protein